MNIVGELGEETKARGDPGRVGQEGFAEQVPAAGVTEGEGKQSRETGRDEQMAPPRAGPAGCALGLRAQWAQAGQGQLAMPGVTRLLQAWDSLTPHPAGLRTRSWQARP